MIFLLNLHFNVKKKDMKRQIITCILATGAVIGLGSCSLINKVTGKDSNSSVSDVSKDVSQEAVLPHDREHIAAKKEIKKYSPEELAKGVVKGDWAIETVNGKSAVGEKAPFLKFVPSEGRVYGNNGCNALNGGYTSNPADSTISFSKMASTMMMCAKEGITDYEINQALGATRFYTWEIKGSDYYLYFLDSTKRQVMSLMHQNFDFLNGSWNVTRINDTKVNNPDVQLVIDVPEGKVHGNTGCNILNGSLETDMEAANSISFSAIATTRMACPAPNYETELLVALEEASTAKPIRPNEVILLNSQGKQVLLLTRVTNP